MSNAKIKKSELINARLSILLFWSLLMGALLWAERTVWGRRPPLIFLEMLPWLMPTIFGIFALMLIFLIVLWKKGITRKDKIFSTPYLTYLAAAPFTAVFLPWLAVFFPRNQLFGFVVSILYVALIGYFISYIFFSKLAHSTGLLAGFTTLCAAILAGHHLIYLDAANVMLDIDFYPSAKIVAPITAAVLLLLLFALRMMAKKNEVPLKTIALLIPFALTALLLLGTAFFRTSIPVAARSWLALGGIIAIALWLIGRTFYEKMKNRK